MAVALPINTEKKGMPVMESKSSPKDTDRTYEADMKAYLLDQFRILSESIAKLADEVERWQA